MTRNRWTGWTADEIAEIIRENARITAAAEAVYQQATALDGTSVRVPLAAMQALKLALYGETEPIAIKPSTLGLV